MKCMRVDVGLLLRDDLVFLLLAADFWSLNMSFSNEGGICIGIIKRGDSPGGLGG